MNDTITIRGIVATVPRHLVTHTGLSITSFRLASPSRRWDRATSAWVNGDTNWFTVTAFRTLATNVHESVIKGDRVLVAGRLRIRPWEREDRSGVAVEIDGDSIGHDLAFGRSQWRKVMRHTADEAAGPGEVPTPEERAVAAATSVESGVGLEGRGDSGTAVPDGSYTGPVLPPGVPHDPALYTPGTPDGRGALDVDPDGHRVDQYGLRVDADVDADGDGDGSGADDWTARVGPDGVVHDDPGASAHDALPDPVF